MDACSSCERNCGFCRLVNDDGTTRSECAHRSTHFDRSLCACGSMHTYCDDCGQAVDACDVEPRGDYAGDTGSKDDAEKPRTDLLPVAALEEVAHVMTFGAKKYAPYNWQGLSVSRLYGAALRHLWAWWRGEDADPETGRSHLAHAACCVLMALDQMLARHEYDDRPR